MDIEIEMDGFYPAHTRYTRELWMHMIEHCHHQQMRDAFDMDPTNVCWDENSMALAAKSGRGRPRRSPRSVQLSMGYRRDV